MLQVQQLLGPSSLVRDLEYGREPEVVDKHPIWPFFLSFLFVCCDWMLVCFFLSFCNFDTNFDSPPAQMQATIKEEPLEEENEEEESRDDFAPQQRSRWELNLVFLYFCFSVLRCRNKLL